MLKLKKANAEDARAEWEFVRSVPADENGFTNQWTGVSFEDFCSRTLPWMEQYERGENLPEGHVPEVFFFLWDDDRIVGEFRVRCRLTDALRNGAGHIGYAIARNERGKGYGTEGLRLCLKEAEKLVREEEFYLRVRRDNPASLRVMEKNGGHIVHSDDRSYYVRIPNPGKTVITEEKLTEELIRELIDLSVLWEAENSCYGYRRNTKEDIRGNRVFTARRNGRLCGYLFGHTEHAANMTSVIPAGSVCFETEELYVLPEERHRGIGRKLMQCAEDAVRNEVEYILLSTATKNWKAIFHFYIDEVGMEFHSARLFKPLAEPYRIQFLDRHHPQWEAAAEFIADNDWGTSLACMMRENILQEWEKVLVLKDGAEIIGFCCVLENDHMPSVLYSPWIAYVYVKAEYRGKQLSGKMIRAAEAYLSGLGYDRIYIGTTNHERVYERYGYRIIGEADDYKGRRTKILCRQQAD